MYVHPTKPGPVVVPAGGKEGQDVPRGTLNSIPRQAGAEMRRTMDKANSYVYVIERADDGSYWAYLPDLPGCVTSADSVEQVESQLPEAVELYLSYFHDRGLPPPSPQARVGTLTAA